MKSDKSFYITTTIPYVNDKPHIGFALELIQSDAIARFARLMGKEVFFSTGTDEYGQKIWEASQKEGKDTQAYVDYYADQYLDLKDKLNLSYDNFIRTTSEINIKAAQEFWRLCDAKGDVYKKIYKGLYCVGCEKFLNDKDMVDGKCVFHPSLTPEMVEEENYFFKLSRYREDLIKYLSNEKSVLPDWRRKEALEYVNGAMDDFSISRSKDRLVWGIAIPGDETQVMYVWFGAFINYISTLGWPDNTELFNKFWREGETTQTAGKDMVKFQSVMWQGMLMSAGLPLTDQIVYHGFITGEGGVRMSKSLGNVINPTDVVREYGADALRYFLLRDVSTFEDSPFTIERFRESYNANLANGLGNLVARIMKLAEQNLDQPVVIDYRLHGTLEAFMNDFEVQKAMNHIWAEIGELDREIQDKKPWESKDKEVIAVLVEKLGHIGYSLSAFMPETSEKILSAIKNNKLEQNLFPRLA
jgi:methionyl-tRNA synthetase